MFLQVLSLCQCTTARQIIIHYHYYYLFIYFLGYFFGPNLAKLSRCYRQLSAATASFFFFLVLSLTSFLLFLNSSPFATIELNGSKKLTLILALYHSHDSKFRQVCCFQKSAKCFQIVLPNGFSDRSASTREKNQVLAS